MFDRSYIIKYLLDSYDLNLTGNELNIVNKLNDKFPLLLKGLSQTNLNFGIKTIHNYNFSYLFDLFRDDSFSHLFEKPFLNEKGKSEYNLEVSEILRNYIDNNLVEIYNIIKQYI